MGWRILLGLMLVSLVGNDFASFPQAQACAGYTIIVGSDGSPRQELLTQIMAELIRQRTGTKIQFSRFATQGELLAAAERHDVDLLVVAVTQDDLFSKDQLQVLKPFGYQNSQVMPAFQVATLKRFPALQRLVNRLAGIIDDATLRYLEKSLNAGSDLRDVAKKFLTERNLIYGS